MLTRSAVRAGWLNLGAVRMMPWPRRICFVRCEAAARLVGRKRFKVYGQLDLDIMRQVAPMAVERTYNNRYLFSDRVEHALRRVGDRWTLLVLRDAFLGVRRPRKR